MLALPYPDCLLTLPDDSDFLLWAHTVLARMGEWQNFRASGYLTCLGTEGGLELILMWSRKNKFHWRISIPFWFIALSGSLLKHPRLYLWVHCGHLMHFNFY